MMRYLGSIVGTGLLGAILTTGSGVPEIGLFRLIFAVLLGMSALALALAVLVHRFPPELVRTAAAPSSVPPAPVYPAAARQRT
jgi:hypothetical protein